MSSLRSCCSISPVNYPRMILISHAHHLPLSNEQQGHQRGRIKPGLSLCISSAFKCHHCPVGKVRSRIRSGTCKDPFSDFEILYIDVCACLLCSHWEKIREQLHRAVAINRVMVCGCRWFYCPIIVSPSCQREWFVKLFCQWNTNMCVYTLDGSLDYFSCEYMDTRKLKNTSTTVEARLLYAFWRW